MKVAFIGSSCCGKTTTLWEIGSRLKKLGRTDFTLIQEVARECPYQINENSTFETQNWILMNQILTEAEGHRLYKHLICDRSVWDNVVFADALRRRKFTVATWNQRKYLLRVANNWNAIQPYDVLFLFSPLPYKVDGQRSKHPAFQKIVAREFEDFFYKFRVPIIKVSHESRESRAEFVYRKIMELMYP